MEPQSITEGGERPREGDDLRGGQLEEGGRQKVGIKRRDEEEEDGEDSSPTKKRVH